MAKIQRVIDNSLINSPADATSIEYNPAAGGKKTVSVGPRLIPIQIASGYTTNVSAGVTLPNLGACLAIYNNAGAVGSVTVGASVSTVAAALTPGATDANGNVGVACPPNAWTYLSAGNNQYVISTAATLLVYIIEDPTRFIQETPNRVAQNIPGFAPPINS